mmetsp:Transcript_31198/g.84642  ORF Transcript_31198/g.84642 Transcript_31198/m.84642 type:complete len:200 (-) Transcript_31198:1136-1735(-)
MECSSPLGDQGMSKVARALPPGGPPLGGLGAAHWCATVGSASAIMEGLLMSSRAPSSRTPPWFDLIASSLTPPCFDVIEVYPRVRRLGLGRPFMSLMVSVISKTWDVMNLRKSTTSLTVAVLDPRSCSTKSMNSGKDSVASFWNRYSEKSTRPTTSTPTSCTILAAVGFSSNDSNSAFEIFMSPSASRPLVVISSWSFE